MENTAVILCPNCGKTELIKRFLGYGCPVCRAKYTKLSLSKAIPAEEAKDKELAFLSKGLDELISYVEDTYAPNHQGMVDELLDAKKALKNLFPNKSLIIMRNKSQVIQDYFGLVFLEKTLEEEEVMIHELHEEIVGKKDVILWYEVDTYIGFVSRVIQDKGELLKEIQKKDHAKAILENSRGDPAKEEPLKNLIATSESRIEELIGDIKRFEESIDRMTKLPIEDFNRMMRSSRKPPKKIPEDKAE